MSKYLCWNYGYVNKIFGCDLPGVHASTGHSILSKVVGSAARYNLTDLSCYRCTRGCACLLLYMETSRKLVGPIVIIWLYMVSKTSRRLNKMWLLLLHYLPLYPKSHIGLQFSYRESRTTRVHKHSTGDYWFSLRGIQGVCNIDLDPYPRGICRPYSSPSTLINFWFT